MAPERAELQSACTFSLARPARSARWWRVGIGRSRRVPARRRNKCDCRSRSAMSGPMKRTLRRNRGRERGRGPSELMLLARGSVGERSDIVLWNEWRQSHEIQRDPAKGTVRWKALRIAEAAALHGDVVEAVSAARSKSVHSESFIGGNREATGASEVRSYRARRGRNTPPVRRGTARRSEIGRRETLGSPFVSGESPVTATRKSTRRGCSNRVVGWQKSVGRITSYDHAGRREANRVGWF